MTAPTITMVSLTGREIMTQETVTNYNRRGGLSGFKLHHFYFAPEGKHESLAVHTNVDLHTEVYGGMMPDFWKILAFIPEGADWIFLEDDCTPCTNAIVRMVSVEVPDDVGLLSFFDLRNEWEHPGIWRNREWEPNGTRRHLYGAQALKIPARVIPALKKFGEEKRTFSANWDTWLGLAIDALKLRVAHYAPSLVQHLGAISVAYPGTTHQRPITHNFPGEDFDALGECPDPIIPGKWQSSAWDFSSHPNWCGLHQVMHAGGNTCPKITGPFQPVKHGIAKKLPPTTLQGAFEAGFQACCGRKPGTLYKARYQTRG